MCYNLYMIKKCFKKNIVLFIILILMIGVFYFMFNNKSIYDFICSIDYGVRDIISSDNVLFVNIMKVFTFIGNAYIPILLIIILYMIKNKKKDTYILACVYVFSGIVIFICKYLINRDRPLEALISIPSSPSFPSGHAFTSMVFYFTFAYIISKDLKRPYKNIVICIFILLSLIIGFSRIYLGVHFFSDVVCGFVFAVPVLLIGINSYNIIKEEKI